VELVVGPVGPEALVRSGAPVARTRWRASGAYPLARQWRVPAQDARHRSVVGHHLGAPFGGVAGPFGTQPTGSSAAMRAAYAPISAVPACRARSVVRTLLPADRVLGVRLRVDDGTPRRGRRC